MTFISVIKKNFIHNFNKYISFYFVNSLITAMLFMYGSLMFNESVKNSIKGSSISETIQMSFVGLVIFAIVFITYTNIAFLKNRGKEFGMYLTLGMTRSELIKVILFENLAVMLAALATGVMSGIVLGKLFYMGLSKFLNVENLIFKVDMKSILLSVLIFTVIFASNMTFNIFYLKNVKIIDAIKSKTKKGVGKSNYLLGGLSVVLLVVAMLLLPQTLLENIFKEQRYMVGVFIVITFIAPYIIIGCIITILKKLLEKFPKTYNKNIIVLSNLSHKFVEYKNMIYILGLLITGAVFFCGFSYASYTMSEAYTREDNPFDVMFIETDKYNKVDSNEVKSIVGKAGVEEYKELEFLEMPSFVKDDGIFSYWDNNTQVMSESAYNKHMGTNFNVAKGDLIDIAVYKENMAHVREGKIIASIGDEKVEKIVEALWGENPIDYLTQEHMNEILAGEMFIDSDGEKLEKLQGQKYANHIYSIDYGTGTGVIIDDEDYLQLKQVISQDKIKKMHGLNVKDEKKARDILNENLMSINKFDNTYWNNENIGRELSEENERDIAESYRPFYTFELVELKISESGMMLFVMSFIGLLFVVANGVVLYYKILSDIEDEKERVKSLNRIGASEKEIKKIINKELLIVFFSPIIVGCSMGMYYLYVMGSNTNMIGQIMCSTLVVVGFIIILQIIFYFTSRKKYIKSSTIEL